jgi:hypothetical protein
MWYNRISGIRRKRHNVWLFYSNNVTYWCHIWYQKRARVYW